MVASSKSTAPRAAWLSIATAVAATLILWPPAARFYSPTAIGYVQLPGVLLFVLLAVLCTTCFLTCPRCPFILKLFTGLLAAHSLFWALYAIAWYGLHAIYRS